jgi:hypothetical protein
MYARKRQKIDHYDEESPISVSYILISKSDGLHSFDGYYKTLDDISSKILRVLKGKEPFFMSDVSPELSQRELLNEIQVGSSGYTSSFTPTSFTQSNITKILQTALMNKSQPSFIQMDYSYATASTDLFLSLFVKKYNTPNLNLPDTTGLQCFQSVLLRHIQFSITQSSQKCPIDP